MVKIRFVGLRRLTDMSLGRAPRHEDLHRSTRAACEARLPEPSIFRLLSRASHRLFPDEAFVDLFSDIGRCSVPPRIVAVAMVLQRVHGLSDREAADAFAFDLRWKYAAGALDFDHPGFVHTVFVDMRERLRRSERPTRIFEVVLAVAKETGLVGRKRVLDSTAPSCLPRERGRFGGGGGHAGHGDAHPRRDSRAVA